MTSWEGSEVSPPAPLVPAADLADLVALLVTALAAEVKGGAGDATKSERACYTAVSEMEAFLDVDGGDDNDPVYATPEDVEPRVFAALVELAAASLKRPGFAYGVAGYDEADPMAVRARGAILSALTPGVKQRWGVG